MTSHQKPGCHDGNWQRFLDVVAALRGEHGCPWDKEQTYESLTQYVLEEAHEVVASVLEKDADKLREELGDLLLEIGLYCQIASERGDFQAEDVLEGIIAKLIRRHPHVFGNIKVSDSDEVLKNWNNIKQTTKGQETYTETLESICKALPALMRAQKTGQRAKRAGMDFSDTNGAVARLEDEVSELKQALNNNASDLIEDEIGDVLFSAVNVSRLTGIDAEEALSKATDKFIRRFAAVEKMIRCDGQDMKALTIDELDAYWQKAKLL